MGILEIKNVGKRFGGLQALGDVNLSVAEKHRACDHRTKRCGKINAAELSGGQAYPRYRLRHVQRPKSSGAKNPMRLIRWVSAGCSKPPRFSPI